MGRMGSLWALHTPDIHRPANHSRKACPALVGCERIAIRIDSQCIVAGVDGWAARLQSNRPRRPAVVPQARRVEQRIASVIVIDPVRHAARAVLHQTVAHGEVPIIAVAVTVADTVSEDVVLECQLCIINIESSPMDCPLGCR